jgi:antitoxin (DNA-binding transcriptional repressor) of toxin-antitoxin stability system
MATVTIEEAQATLLELIHQLPPGEEVVITENNQPVAKLARILPTQQWPCQAGTAKGKMRSSTRSFLAARIPRQQSRRCCHKSSFENSQPPCEQSF